MAKQKSSANEEQQTHHLVPNHLEEAQAEPSLSGIWVGLHAWDNFEIAGVDKDRHLGEGRCQLAAGEITDEQGNFCWHFATGRIAVLSDQGKNGCMTTAF